MNIITTTKFNNKFKANFVNFMAINKLAFIQLAQNFTSFKLNESLSRPLKLIPPSLVLWFALNTMWDKTSNLPQTYENAVTIKSCATRHWSMFFSCPATTQYVTLTQTIAKDVDAFDSFYQLLADLTAVESCQQFWQLLQAVDSCGICYKLLVSLTACTSWK